MYIFSKQRFTWVIISLFVFPALSFAQEQTDQTKGSFPYEDCFTVTGYYSPLPDQNRYATGSYQSEIRLEGRGTNGADGTQVYVGMIAAAPEIPFGTKIYIPGIGIGTVHDRGGAIKTYDGQCGGRLDVWMGFGDKGLERTLNWGVRKVKAIVHGMNDSVKEDIILEGYSEAENLLREKIMFFKPKHFKEDLGPKDQGSQVQKLQEKLAEFAYYSGQIHGLYDESTTEAVYRFQTEFDVLTERTTLGAGYFGINTRTAMDRAIDLLSNAVIDDFPLNLGAGSRGPFVKKLQLTLSKIGYLSSDNVNEEYDQTTVDAVLKFQLDYNVIQTSEDRGAGYFGPSTRATLRRVATNKTSLNTDQNKIINTISDSRLNDFADLNEKFTTHRPELARGAEGENVRQLQEELRRLGYFRHEITGYYGDVTEHAVFKLQQAWGLVPSNNHPSAGKVDQATASKLNSVTQGRLNMKVLIAGSRMGSKETVAAENSELNEEVLAGKNPPLEDSTESSPTEITLFPRELVFGDQGSDVKLLQKLLKALGYFKNGFVTDYFGEFTKQAVISFQLARGIIFSQDDDGSGQVGSETLEELQKSVKVTSSHSKASASVAFQAIEPL